ncbi:MAG: NAD(P)H-quinone oxidoreductase [Myxococcota bacterium]
MKAVLQSGPGDESVLSVGEAPEPELGPGDLRLQVAACAVNRADLMQRQGLYPPPPGASPLLGLECAGEVIEVGDEVEGWSPGARAMALLAGGGYAEQVVTPAGCALPVPAALTLEEAAALPEVFLTVFLNVFQLGGLPDGGTALVHGGGSGIGTAAIALVKAAGASIIVTAGSANKCERCRALGADLAVDYEREDFVQACRDFTAGRGVDVVLDSIGAPYLERNLGSLTVGGRLVLIGLMGGARAEINLGSLLAKRLQVVGSTLRARPVAEKALLVSAFWDRFGGAIEKGELKPVVDRVLPLEEVAEAHRLMKASEHFGKIVLRVGG